MIDHISVFKEELNKIKNDDIRTIVRNYLEMDVPKYFWEVPASSTGKYHPSFDQGLEGLVRHTSMTVAVALEMSRLYSFSEKDMDIILAACIIHDTFKNGYVDNNKTVFSHPDIAAAEFYRSASVYLDAHDEVSDAAKFAISEICRAVASHMGQWGRIKPVTAIDNFVAECDFIASRKFFDKFANATLSEL